MKQGIHPEWYPEAQVVCSCGNTFTVGATQEVIRTDVCSACHPFFTGEQRIVDTEGQVDRFMKRLERHSELKELEKKRQTKAERRREARAIAEFAQEEEPEEPEEPEDVEEAEQPA